MKKGDAFLENAKKFFEEAIKTEEAKELLNSYEKPKTEEETYKIYSEVAGKLGIELSVEEIRAYLEEKNATEELDDEELSKLSGGGDHPDCKDTYQNRENCWWDDACDLVLKKYDDYECKTDFNGSYAMIGFV